LAFDAEEGTAASSGLMAVLISTEEQELTIIPTHRLVQHVNGIEGTPIEPPGDELPGLVLYRDGEYQLMEGNGRLDVDRVDALQPQGVTYTPHARDAVAAVDRGDAAAAFLLRPPRIEDVF